MRVIELTELLGYSKQSFYMKRKTDEQRDINESLVLSIVKKEKVVEARK